MRAQRATPPHDQTSLLACHVGGAFGTLMDCRILIDDAKGAQVNAEYVRDRAQWLVNSSGPAALILDYLQLVNHEQPKSCDTF
jgi:hypothetical protein